MGGGPAVIAFVCRMAWHELDMQCGAAHLLVRRCAKQKGRKCRFCLASSSILVPPARLEGMQSILAAKTFVAFSHMLRGHCPIGSEPPVLRPRPRKGLRRAFRRAFAQESGIGHCVEAGCRKHRMPRLLTAFPKGRDTVPMELKLKAGGKLPGAHRWSGNGMPGAFYAKQSCMIDDRYGKKRHLLRRFLFII